MLKHLCKNKRELKDVIFKGFFLHKVENKQTNHTQKKERKILLNYPITIPFRSHSQTAQPVFRTDPPLTTLKKKPQKKNYLSAHSGDTNMEFRDGCLEGTSGINTSTSNASLCIIQPLKLCPSLPFPDSVTRGRFRWPARTLAHSDRKPLDPL